ncbi:hydantoinase/oxoprolinase family protein [Marinibaculum pumilum]|uniref:Hydantoinase/oxoprolinase family protein n=1 Tax=Marinibaculum pumilum TaxID=1766165 RepID=A0ABV7L669_9PROT
MAVEVGGTFTDLIWIEDGQVRSRKVPSTPEDPSEGVISGLQAALGQDLSRMSELCHGSTVATNAIIERRGCRAALVTTRGFRDVLELQRQLRANVYAIACGKPEPLVPLRRSIEAPERLDAHGAVIEPLDETSLIAAVDDLVAREAPEALAVCLLHSYLDPQHELRIRALLAERHPDLPVILSSDVLPTFREYERASTTAMAAYLAPLVGRYIGRLERHMAEHAPQSDLFVMQSSGGVLPGGGALDRGVHMLNSGPAAGVIGAVRVAAIVGDADVITLDIGGTSSDIALIRSGTAGVTAETEVNGLPVGLPSTDIANIGAGGGSLGHIDRGGMLRVGPRSAGARPGPACYGHGGTDPAITDALVQLGWIRPDRFLGGKMALHPDRAAEALGKLGASASDAAQAMVDIAIAHIGQGIRLVSVQRGHDAKSFALYGYGGMGPMMSALAAEDLKIKRVVIPPHPGLFSALGLLVSDLKRIYRETNLMKVDADAPARVAASFERMRERAVEEFTRLGRHRDELVFDHALEMRYSGQGFELLTEIDLDRLPAQGHDYLERLFHDTHIARYGSASREPVEIVTLRLVAQIPADGHTLRELTRGPLGVAAPELEEAAVTFRGTRMQCRFAWRDSLPKGHVLRGPAIVEEPTATTLVPPGWQAAVHETGSLILEKEVRA